jgi:hypothetical protein
MCTSIIIPLKVDIYMKIFNQGEQGERGLSGEDGLPGQQVSFSCWL